MARHFDHLTDDKINAGNLAAGNAGAECFTVATWVRMGTLDENDTVIVSKRNWDNGTGWELKIRDWGAETLRWDVQPTTTGRVRVEAAAVGLTDGNWHLLVADCCRINNILSLYFDGALIGTTGVVPITGDVSNSVNLMINGAPDKTDRATHCDQAEVAFFKIGRILNADERAALWDLFSPRFFFPAFHFELIGNESPEPDFWAGGLGTLVNTPTKEIHPPIIRPSALFQLPCVGQPRPLAGSIDGKGDFAPNLGVDWLIYGSINGAADIAANISNNYRIEGTVDGKGDLAGFLSAGADLAGHIGSQGDLAGRLSRNHAIRGTIGGQSSITGDLSTTVDIAGSIDAQSSISGQLAEDLHGQIDGQSNVSGFLSAASDLGGHIGGDSTIDGSLTLAYATKGSIDGESDLSGLLGTIAPIEGAIDGQSDLSGSLDRQPTLAGSIDGQSSISGDISPVVPLNGTIGAQSTIAGDLDLILGLIGSIDGVSVLRGRLRIPGEVLTTSVGGLIIAKTSVGGFIVSKTPTGGWIVGGQ